MTPPDFWTLTPWQFRVCCEAYAERLNSEHDRNAWMMWHGAVLARVKDIPPLEDFTTAKLEKKKTGKGIDELAIMARLKAYKARYEAGER